MQSPTLACYQADSVQAVSSDILMAIMLAQAGIHLLKVTMHFKANILTEH